MPDMDDKSIATASGRQEVLRGKGLRGQNGRGLRSAETGLLPPDPDPEEPLQRFDVFRRVGDVASRARDRG